MTVKLKIADSSNVVINLVEIEAELRPMDTLKLRNILVESMGNVAMWIARSAVCVKLMEERGEPLVGTPQLSLLRKVASGQVLPETVLVYGESPARHIVLQAPLQDQQKLVKSPLQPVLEQTPNGGLTTRMVDLTKACKEVVKQVLGPEGIRTTEEQKGYLASQRLESMAKQDKTLPKSAKPHEPMTNEVKVRFTTAEYHYLNTHASSNGMFIPDFIRKMLDDARYLSKPKK